MAEAIVVRGLGKRFRRYDPQRPNTLQEALSRGFHRLRPADYFWALKEVSFSLAAGKMVGLIGRNGAGKSTLLRLIGGGGRPDEGSLSVNGRIGALIELGAGFHPDLTGKENIYINGVISGLTRCQVAERYEQIIRFAEIEDFIESPLRTYSTGMQMRLAFAVAVHIDPEILLIDEVLAVGDLAFQRKCLERIGEFKQRGCTILLVSHDATLVGQMCDEAIWLEAGRVAAHGPAEVVAKQYVASAGAETTRRTPASGPPRRLSSGMELRVNDNRFGSLEIELSDVRLTDQHGLPAAMLYSGDSLRVELEYLAPEAVEQPIFGVAIVREDGLVCYDTTTYAAGVQFPRVQGRGKVCLQLDRLDLMGGRYFVDVGVYKGDWSYAYDYHWQVYPLTVKSEGPEKGILRPPHHWEVGGG